MSTAPPISVGLLLRNTPEGLGRCLHALIVAYADITTSGPVPELAAPADIGMHRGRIEKWEDESMPDRIVENCLQGTLYRNVQVLCYAFASFGRCARFRRGAKPEPFVPDSSN